MAANFQLAMILAVVAGILNSVGFVAVSLYSSHMTGMVASTADQLATGALSVVALHLLAIISFILGAATCAVLFNWGRRRTAKRVMRTCWPSKRC